jgi:hypothetical protein
MHIKAPYSIQTHNNLHLENAKIVASILVVGVYLYVSFVSLAVSVHARTRCHDIHEPKYIYCKGPDSVCVFVILQYIVVTVKGASITKVGLPLSYYCYNCYRYKMLLCMHTLTACSLLLQPSIRLDSCTSVLALWHWQQSLLTCSTSLTVPLLVDTQ